MKQTSQLVTIKNFAIISLRGTLSFSNIISHQQQYIYPCPVQPSTVLYFATELGQIALRSTLIRQISSAVSSIMPRPTEDCLVFCCVRSSIHFIFIVIHIDLTPDGTTFVILTSPYAKSAKKTDSKLPAHFISETKKDSH